jgi:DNA-binding CsgD family transcriptional regulator
MGGKGDPERLREAAALGGEMGDVRSPIRSNSVVAHKVTEFREQPTWNYYSQVSIASPHARVADRQDVSQYAALGSMRHEAVDPAPGSAALSFDRPDGGSFAGESRKGESKQWGPWSLTQRELDVIQLLAEGATNCEMSERLFISPKTTKNHLAAIFQKLDVTNRTQALVRAVVMGLVSIDGDR